jgi:hypothetical protein
MAPVMAFATASTVETRPQVFVFDDSELVVLGSA